MPKKNKTRKALPLARPHMTAAALKNVQKCFTENFYSHGFFNTQFEKEFAKFHGMKYAVSCSNGTAALWLALKALGIGPGDEVIVPTLTFAATIGAVTAVGATPVLVDSKEDDGTISPEGVRKAISSRTKAVIPVDLYGLPADYAELKKILAAKNIPIVQDAAEALGGTYKGKFIGTQGDVSCFSFFGNKVLTTGEGGMCLTNSKELHDLMVLYKNHGTANRAYWVEVPGFNMRMTNIQAGIGISQLAVLSGFLEKRFKIFETYENFFKKIKGIQQLPFTNRKYGPWMMTIQVPSLPKDAVVTTLADYGIEARPGFFPLHLTPAFSSFARNQKFPVAEAFAEHLVNLPTFIGLTSSDIKRVAEALEEIIARV